MTNSILFPTDFSANSRKALDYAIALANQLHKDITLLHVYDLQVPDHRFTPRELRATMEAKEAEIWPRFHDFLKDIDSKISFETVIKRGNLTKKLKACSQTYQFEWLVACTTQNRTFKDFLFGSNIEEMIADATMPVMLIPEQQKSFKNISTIVFPTALTDDNILAIQKLDDFAMLFHATIRFVHVSNHLTKKAIQLARDYKRALEKLIKSPFVLEVIETRYVSSGIKTYAKQNDADLLAMFRKSRSFVDSMLHSSITSKMVHDFDSPLLILPEEKFG
ncbi:MAG: universal stress protein [Chitinophagales bacterium]